MISYLNIWLLLFLLFSIFFIALVEVIRRALGNQVRIWQTIANIIAFWLSSYILFFILEFSPYLEYYTFSRLRTPVNAVIILSITASIWYTVTSRDPVKTPIPITFFVTGILFYTISAYSPFHLISAYILVITGFISGIIAALYFAGQTTVPTSLTPMLRAGAQILFGAILLFVMYQLFILQEQFGWWWNLLGFLNVIFSPLYFFLIVNGVYFYMTFLFLGWLLIGLGYWQFRYQDWVLETKAELHTHTDWTHKSGTVLILLAIINLIFSFLINPLNILSWLFLISILLQFILGVHLREWGDLTSNYPLKS